MDDRARFERDVLTPLERFIRRSRVKPTELQIESALLHLSAVRAALASALEAALRRLKIKGRLAVDDHGKWTLAG